MNAILIFLVSFGSAYLASRLARRGPFTLADGALALTGALIAFGLERSLGGASAGWSLGLPLLLALVLPLGLASLQRRPLAW